VIEANETAIDSLALTSLSGVSITSPVDNQLLTYNGTNWVNEAPAGSVLQVVRATDVTQRSTTSTTFTDAGLSVSITPTSSTSAIQVVHAARANVTRAAGTVFCFLRITTAAGVAISGAEDLAFNVPAPGGLYPSYIAGWHLPGSTATVTYKVQFRAPSSMFIFSNEIAAGQLFAIEVAV